MPSRKLTIVVTCTDRKFLAPHPRLTARTLPVASVAERAGEWTRRLHDTSAVTTLASLYKGESWTQVRRLWDAALKHGYDTELLIASAGLGLRRVATPAAPYSATFSRGQPDSVAATTADTTRWWDLLPHDVPRVEGPSLWVLSEAYAKAMRNTLKDLDPSASLVFGGSLGIADDSRVPSDRALRPALGGTATSLNLRMAIQLLAISDGQSLWAPETRAAWDRWASGARQVERYDRAPVTDDAVRTFVANLRAVDCAVTKTRALRLLRSSGLACEQKRFSSLFEEAPNP